MKNKVGRERERVADEVLRLRLFCFRLLQLDIWVGGGRRIWSSRWSCSGRICSFEPQHWSSNGASGSGMQGPGPQGIMVDHSIGYFELFVSQSFIAPSFHIDAEGGVE